VVVSSQATGSLYGVVTDKQGSLVPRAAVVATLKGAPSGPGSRIFETETNDRGRFKLENLPFGLYDVHVSFAGSGVQIGRTVSVPRGKAVEIDFELGYGCDEISEASGIVNDADKAEVVRLTLVQAISPKLRLLEQKQRDERLILSSRNIKPEWLKGVTGIRIRLLSEKEIQREADLHGDFLYMSFPEIRVRGECITVTVANSWAVGRHSRMVYLSGGGYTYEYRKELGKWTGRFVSGWIS